MIAHAIVFYIFSLIAIVSAIMVTVSKNTVNSVFFLILDFISISCLFIMIGAEFLGMIMLIVYVGAVAVLFLFVVMMLNVAQQKNEWFNSSGRSSHIPVGLLVSIIIFFELIIVIGGWKYKPDLLDSIAIKINTDLTNTQSLGSVNSCCSRNYCDYRSGRINWASGKAIWRNAINTNRIWLYSCGVCSFNYCSKRKCNN